MPNNTKNKKQGGESYSVTPEEQRYSREMNDMASARLRAQSLPGSAAYQALMEMLPDSMAYSQPFDPVTGQATEGPGYAGIFRNQPPTYMIPGSPLGFTQEAMSMAPWEDVGEGKMFADEYLFAANMLNDPWTQYAMQRQGIPQRMVGGATPGFDEDYPWLGVYQPGVSPNRQFNYVNERSIHELPYGNYTRFMTPQGVLEPNIAVDEYGNRIYPIDDTQSKKSK